MHNDIWSLGIILLNLVTGRNPWKSAVMEDATYKAYHRDPLQFLPGVLPISDEFNRILVQVLHVDWKKRMSLDKLRDYVINVKNFYSDSVIFEGSLARCPWEAGLDLGNGPAQQQQQHQHHQPQNPPEQKRAVPNIPENVEPYCVFSMSEMPSEYTSQAPETDETMEDASWDPVQSEYDFHDGMDVYDEGVRTPYETSGRSTYTSDSSSPATPNSVEFPDRTFERAQAYDHERYYDAESPMYPSFNNTSTTDTDDNRFASSVFLATPMVESKPFPFPRSDAAYRDGYRTQKRYSSPNTSVYSVAEYSDDTSEQFPPTSPNFAWPSAYDQSKKGPRIGASRPIDIQQQAHRGSSTSKLNKSKQQNGGSGLFGALRFFPRSSGSWLNAKAPPHAMPPPPPQKATNNTAANSAAAAARMHPVSPPQVPMMHWNEYNRYPPHPHHARPAANVGNPVHFAGRAFGPQLRSTRDWISG